MQVLTTASQPALTLPRSNRHLNGSDMNHPHAPALEPAPHDRRNVPRADVIVRTCSCELERPLSPRSCRCTLGVWGVQSPDEHMGRVIPRESSSDAAVC
jgi:hypothetical protein